MPAIHHPLAEIAAARAAHAAGTAFTVSTASSYPVREIAARAPGPLWFQLYLPPDRGLADGIVAQARAAGCRVLMLTVDTALPGQRERDIRNGFTLPPRVTPLNSRDIVTHPLRTVRWGRRFLRGPGVRMGTVDAVTGQGGDLREILNPTSDWSDVAWLRERWPGPIVLKGIMTAHDARMAVEHGVDGVLVSNHGGRQLDGLPATLDVLPDVVEAVAGTGAAVLLDGGVRRGTDVLKALALGADACLVARPWTWGLSAGGEAGVARVLEIFRAEIDRALGLLGVTSIREVDATLVRSFERPGMAAPA
jgi:isopentenyl diphosphate isomerase/L-lactate dehydrogenase-like FMN-dependent dehydrogenase